MRWYLVALFTVVLGPVGQTAEVIDPAKATADPKDPILWYDIRLLGVEGQGWNQTKEPFDRLPAKAEGVVRAPIWNLSRHSAGLCARFVTDSPSVHARWSLSPHPWRCRICRLPE